VDKGSGTSELLARPLGTCWVSWLPGDGRWVSGSRGGRDLCLLVSVVTVLHGSCQSVLLLPLMLLEMKDHPALVGGVLQCLHHCQRQPEPPACHAGLREGQGWVHNGGCCDGAVQSIVAAQNGRLC